MVERQNADEEATGPALTNNNAVETPEEAGNPNTRAIAHRVKASRSVLALVVDDEYVFAGLQGGDIVVSGIKFVLHDQAS